MLVRCGCLFKTQHVNLHERKLKTVPNMIQHLDDFKLRLEYSQTNKQVIGKGKSYPKVHWYTVILVDAGEPDKLHTDLKNYPCISRHFTAISC